MPIPVDPDLFIVSMDINFTWNKKSFIKRACCDMGLIDSPKYALNACLCEILIWFLLRASWRQSWCGRHRMLRLHEGGDDEG